jgi:hypothetical protein
MVDLPLICVDAAGDAGGRGIAGALNDGPILELLYFLGCGGGGGGRGNNKSTEGPEQTYCDSLKMQMIMTRCAYGSHLFQTSGAGCCYHQRNQCHFHHHGFIRYSVCIRTLLFTVLCFWRDRPRVGSKHDCLSVL